MRKLTVILGAGASVSSGLPSLGGIFADEAVMRYLKSDGLPFLKFLEQFVWSPRQIGESDRWKGLNLEEVLTMLRLWENDDQSPLNWKKNRSFQKHLLGCVYNSVFVDKSNIECGDYSQLILLADEQFDHITWASFNWDTKLEEGFLSAFPAFSTSEQLPSCSPSPVNWPGINQKHLFLKLHGSVSWFANSSGMIIHKGSFFERSNREIADSWNDFLENGRGLVPMIAEPSFFKHERIKGVSFLRRQWRRFHAELGQSDVILVVGYSLPDGDAMAKQALLTAVARNQNVRVWVVDPDQSGQVESRYVRIFGRQRLHACNQELAHFLLQRPALL